MSPTLRVADELAGGTTAEDRIVADAPAMSQAEIRAVFADELRRDPGELVGRSLRVVFRMKAGAAVVRKEWYGTVRSCGGTARAPSFRVEYSACSFGPLLDDDGISPVSEFGLLPPRNTDLIDVLHVEFVPSLPDSSVDASSSDDGCPLHESRSDPSDPDKDDDGDDTGPTAFIDPYPRVDDVAAELDLALWPDSVPAVPIGAPGFSIDGRTFLSYGVLDFDVAKRRTPSIVWAAVTEAVRRAHVADISRFRGYLLQRPKTLHLPLDVLLAHHLQILRVEREWAWSTVSRVSAGLIGALASFPVYSSTHGAPSIPLARMPHFRAILMSSARLAAAIGPREPVPASPDDVRVALEHLSSVKAKVALLLCWFSAARPCDVLSLRAENVLFDTDNRIALNVRRGKVVNSVGAYHLHTRIDSDHHFKMVQDFVKDSAGFLFPLRSGYQRQVLLTELRLALRCSRPTLELRSLRRGSLQLLAKAGASEAELLCFSRHTTARQLRRYLGFEAVPHADQQSGVAKASVLARGLSGGYPREFASPEIRINDWLAVTAEGDIIVSRERAPHLSSDGVDRSLYALLAKAQTTVPIDLAAVDALAAAAPESVRLAWAEARRLLSDADNFHSRVPWSGEIRPAVLRPGDITKLLQINNVAVVSPDELHKVRGTIQVFLTPEDAKKRFRVIKHPAEYNSFYGRETLIPTVNSTKRSARRAIPISEGSITIDLVAEFDQIPLDDDVSFCQAFRIGRDIFRSLRLPMGGRHSTTIGTALLRVLLAFDMPGVIVDWATDAARFAGPRELVVEAAWTFVQRCRRVLAKANEVDCATATRADVEALFRTTDADFLGEVADYEKKTVKCRQRHVDKLQAYYKRSFEPDCTYADLFGLYGLLFYMSDTLALRVDKRLRTRLAFSRMARELAADPSKWLTPARVHLPLADIGAWYAEAVANRPAHIRQLPDPDTVIIGDACRLGYAGIVVHRHADGRVSTDLLQRRWPAAGGRGTLSVGLSTVSEPEAAIRLLDAARRIYPSATFAYVTDHEPFVGAVARGFSVSPDYNSRVGRVLDSHPSAFFAFQPGDSMLADRYSRFEASVLSTADREAAKAVASAFLGGVMGQTCLQARDLGRGRLRLEAT
jgi:integrase